MAISSKPTCTQTSGQRPIEGPSPGIAIRFARDPPKSRFDCRIRLKWSEVNAVAFLSPLRLCPLALLQEMV
jgi:hypothetical protein